MTAEEFKLTYLFKTLDPIMVAQLMVDEISPTTDYEMELVANARNYLSSVRKLHRSAFKFGIEVFK